MFNSKRVFKIVLPIHEGYMFDKLLEGNRVGATSTFLTNNISVEFLDLLAVVL